MTRTVLVTGAGGFVGSHLAQGFANMGDTVIAVDARFDATTRARLTDVEVLETPLADVVLAAGRLVDLVIHGAAVTTPPEVFSMTPQQHISTNIASLEIGLRLAKQHRATDFVFLSSSGVFSLEDGKGVQLESTPPTAAIPYAVAKRAGEAATATADSATMRAISVRLGPIYGPFEASRDTRKIVSQVRRWLDCVDSDRPIVVEMPEERRDWTFAPDLPHALNALLQTKLSGVVHFTSADILSNLELANLIAGMVEGVEVRVEPSGAAPRLPIASERLDLRALYPWTSLEAGLSATRCAEVVR